MTPHMDEATKQAQWSRYSRVWRNVLGVVLDWPAERVGQYIEELKQEMETGANDPAGYGFFYDLPSRYVVGALLGEGLHKRIMECESNDANPHLIYKRLVRSITGQALERELEREDFDWQQARLRYRREREEIERWLTSLCAKTT